MKEDLLKTPKVMYDFIYNFVIFLQWIYMMRMGENTEIYTNEKTRKIPRLVALPCPRLRKTVIGTPCVESEFELQLCYYVHFWINAPGKDCEPSYSPPKLYVRWYHYCSSASLYCSSMIFPVSIFIISDWRYIFFLFQFEGPVMG